MNKILGAFLIGSPFIGIFVFIVYKEGLRFALEVMVPALIMTALVAAAVYAGVYLWML